MNDVFGLVPIFSSRTGSVMTYANWLDVGIKASSFYLSSLLMKPTFDFLTTLNNLESYVHWTETLILNASLPNKNIDGKYLLQSEYDGQRIEVSPLQVLELIEKLAPDIVILPEGLWTQHRERCEALPSTMSLYLPAKEWLMDVSTTRPLGVYFSDTLTVLEQLQQFKQQSCYVFGDIDLTLMMACMKAGANIIETDRPMRDAGNGLVYRREGILSLSLDSETMRFEPIDRGCMCPICKQQLTRAYLHHIIKETPTLGVRFLAQHNAYYFQTTCCRVGK